MTTSLISKPPWAAYIWSDDLSIFVELPCPVGKAPVIAKYALTEGGMAKALALTVQCANIKKDPPPPGYYRHGEAKPRASVVAPTPLANQPQVLQEAVKRALRKAGMV